MSNPAGKSFQQIWKHLDHERRRQAATAFFASPENANEQRGMTALMAKKLNLRPQKAAKLPKEKAAGYLAAIEAMEEPLAALLVRMYLFAQHRAMLIMFLDELKIPHEDGMIEDGNTTVPEVDMLRAGLEKIRASFAPEDVEIYMSALAASDAAVWVNLSAAMN
jgi:hypothetical protein